MICCDLWLKRINNCGGIYKRKQLNNCMQWCMCLILDTGSITQQYYEIPTTTWGIKFPVNKEPTASPIHKSIPKPESTNQANTCMQSTLLKEGPNIDFRTRQYYYCHCSRILTFSTCGIRNPSFERWISLLRLRTCPSYIITQLVEKEIHYKPFRTFQRSV